MGIKRFNTEGQVPKAEVKAAMHKQRINQYDKVPDDINRRPKNKHTTVKDASRLSISHSDEWWEEALDKALKIIGQTCKIRKACEAAGFSYIELLRRRKVDPEFEKKFQAAYDEGLQSLEDECVRRAFEGVEKPVFFQGVQCGNVQEYSDGMMMFLLKGGRPEKFKDRTQNENTNFNFNLASRLEEARKRGEDK